MTPLGLVRFLIPATRSAAELASWWMFRMSMGEWLLLAKSFAGSIAVIWQRKEDESVSQLD
jgi:hypothetical protein